MFKRFSWQDPARPITGPAPRGRQGTWVIHYPGGGSYFPMGVQIPPYLRNIQASYLAARGHSFGYAWATGQDGSEWEGRGNDFNMASNPGRKWNDQGNVGNFNDVSQSILVMVANGDPASPAAVATINARIATRPDWNVIWHGVVDYTPCAGAGIIRQIRAGIIGQRPAPQPTRPPPAAPSTALRSGDDMIQPVSPYRNSDTRAYGGSGVAANTPHKFGLDPFQIPPGAVAVALNVTTVGARSEGFVTVWPTGPLTGTSFINPKGDGGAASGSIIVGLVDASFMIQTTVQCHLLVDVTAYWIP